jgi:superfamily I DNA and/or RNA helicase
MKLVEELLEKDLTLGKLEDKLQTSEQNIKELGSTINSKEILLEELGQKLENEKLNNSLQLEANEAGKIMEIKTLEKSVSLLYFLIL